MNREIVTLDVTDIEDREWVWSLDTYVPEKFGAFVHAGELVRHAFGATAQEALDNAYREVMALHCAMCHGPLGASNGDCCSVQCETERAADSVLAGMD